MLLSQIFIFIFGLIIGSFLNVLIIRLVSDESIMGRSRCPKCRHILAWYDLIPLFSFLFLGGKCRYCKEKISIQYPIIEIATGLLFLLILNLSVISMLPSVVPALYSVIPAQAGIQIFYLLFIASCLLVIFVSDLKYYIIPDQIIYIAISATILYYLFGISDFGIWNLAPYFWSAFAASGFFLSLVLISRGAWMGMGDVKLAFLMGLMLGWPEILIALFLSFFTGAIVGIFLILLGKKGWKSEIPFGTFLSANTLLVLLFSDVFLNIFSRWFLF